MNYILNLATAFIAAFQLAKDWGAHKATWRRAVVLSLIVVLAVGGTINTYFASRKAAASREADQLVIKGLKTAVETANKAQSDNTALFVTSFGSLSRKLGDMETQVKTAGLQKEAAKLRAELESTQKALKPPQAELVASLGEVTDTLENIGVTERSVQRGLDGTVSFTVKIVNTSTVQAKAVSIFLRVCEPCKFAEEPKEFIKPIGTEDYDRQMTTQLLAATTGIAVPLKIKPPEGKHRFELAVTLRCENCTAHQKQALYINY